MAIASERIKNTGITKLVNTDYMSVNDRTNDTPTNTGKSYLPIAASSKLNAIIGKKNIFDTVPNTVNRTSKAVSLYPNNNALSNSTNDRNIGVADITLFGGIQYNINAGSVLAHITTGLPESKILAIENMFSSELSKYSRGTRNLSTIDKQIATLRGVANISKALSEVGVTIKDKKNLNALLNCQNMSGINGGESRLIGSIILSGLLMQSLCISIIKFTETIVDLYSTGKYSYADIVNATIKSFTISEHSSTDKVLIMASINTLITPKNNSATAATNSKINMFIDSTSSGTHTGRSTTTGFTSMTGALSGVSNSWSRDDQGNLNMSKMKGNGYASGLSASSIKNISITPSTITTTPMAPTGDKQTAILIMASNMTTNKILDGNSLIA